MFPPPKHGHGQTQNTIATGQQKVVLQPISGYWVDIRTHFVYHTYTVFLAYFNVTMLHAARALSLPKLSQTCVLIVF